MCDKGEFICCICLHYFHEPTAVPSCCHVFCRMCIARCSACPLCRTPIFALVISRSTILAMDDAVDSCTYCRFSGSLTAVGIHQKVSCRAIHSSIDTSTSNTPSNNRQTPKRKKRSALRDKKKRKTDSIIQRQSERVDSLSSVYAFGRNLLPETISIEEQQTIDVD